MAFPWAAVAGSVAGLFSGPQQGEMTWQQQVLLNMIIKNLRAQKQYGQGVPGSDPQEQAALAQAKTLAGGDFAQGREGLLAGLGTENPNSADALERFGSAQSAQMAGIDFNALMQALQSRQSVKFGLAGQAAAGLGAATAARPAPTPGMDFSGLIAQLGRQSGYGSGPSLGGGGGSGTLPPGFGAGLINGIPPAPLTGTATTPNYGAQQGNPMDFLKYLRG